MHKKSNWKNIKERERHTMSADPVQQPLSHDKETHTSLSRGRWTTVILLYYYNKIVLKFILLLLL